MSRVTELTSFIKKDLRDFDYKDVNLHEIWHALYEGQKHLAIVEDCIETKQEITLVEDQSQYDFAFNSGSDGESDQFIIKRIKSLQQPSTWNKLTFPTDEEFDDMKSFYELTVPEVVIIRNNKIEIYAPPGSADDGKLLTLQVFLKAPTLKPDNANEIQTPIEFDTALRYYAVWYLLPLSVQWRTLAWETYESERRKASGYFNVRSNKVKSPKPNW